MYTLYYSPGACSMAVHVLLNELGAAYKLEEIRISKGEQKSPEFLKINPRGAVPVLVDNGVILREAAAIILYLTSKHPSLLFPKQDSKEYTKAVEWLMFANATMHPAYSKGFFLKKLNGADTPFMEATTDQINRLWADVEAQLASTEFVCGNAISAVDILLAVIANWSSNFPAVKLGPNVKRMLKSVILRPAYQKALTTEQVEYKAAA